MLLVTRSLYSEFMINIMTYELGTMIILIVEAHS